MAVLKNDRGISEMEAYNTAAKLRAELTRILLRNFGIKTITGKYLGSFTEEEIKKITEKNPRIGKFIRRAYKLEEELETHEILREYPAWVTEMLREKVIATLNNLVDHVVRANGYPVNFHELEIRRDYQNAAIKDCEILLQDLQYAMQILPIDVNKLLPYVDKVEFEIAVLKGWRKANGKIAKRIRKQEASKQKTEGK